MSYINKIFINISKVQNGFLLKNHHKLVYLLLFFTIRNIYTAERSPYLFFILENSDQEKIVFDLLNTGKL